MKRPDSISYVRQLKQIADELLFQESQVGLQAAAARLYSLLSHITGIDAVVDDPGHSTDIFLSTGLSTGLPNGTAISPKDAAACVLDFARTSKFLRGTWSAVLAAQKRFPGRPIEILYAGCGPFAPFAVLLTALFPAEQVQFTLLDIHNRSLESAARIFHTLGLEAFVRDYVQCDAASYVHQPIRDLHIVIIETMQRALEKEPQVAATLNLASQLSRGGILIPEKITVDACLCDLTEELLKQSSGSDSGPNIKNRIKLGRIFTLTAEDAHSLSESLRRENLIGEARLPAVVLEIPRGISEDLKLMLLTKVTVFESIVLDECESGLTFPVVLHALSLAGGGERIEFRYSLGSSPGFTYEWK